MLGSRFVRAAGGAVAAVACALAVGCGGDGTHRVSGTVTFKGQPVPVGKIYFTPDATKGGSGPSGYADIKDGKYDTASAGGHGAPAGAVVISIEAFDPNAKPDKVDKSDTSGEVLIKSLFPRYEVQADLPASSSTKDVDVPASAATAKPKQVGGPLVSP
ncbi:hypothetical protein R5W23_002488 [Gemmata sp. JC673]|uniref:Carboxypeptidase regulatory-like domain-containing protein n=1 Tax=Gemmata algarum TaxID=2975278 RepID=A0ABU5F1F0_9BACT|nr:hypothetical protein [Gemmata algarum]MDY3561226.1 hypothetical protein [Gemmata algarum]